MSLDPWAPPKSDLAPEPRRGVGLTRAVIDGVLAILANTAVSGLLILFYLPAMRGLSLRDALRYERGVPHFGEVAAIMRLVGVTIGAAVASGRYRGRWLGAAAALGVTYLLAWALPAVLLTSNIAPFEWLGIGLSLPAALLGGALGALTTRSSRRRR